MFESIKEFLNDIFTGIDGRTHDIARVLGALAILNAIGLSIYEVVVNKVKFDIMLYGTGMAALFTGLGAVLYLKRATEPQPTTEEPKV